MRTGCIEPANKQEEESQPFNTVTNLAFMEDGSGYSFISLKANLKLSVKRIAWLSEGGLVDDNQGELISNDCSEIQDEPDIESENKRFVLIHRLVMLTESCPTLYWDAFDDYTHLTFAQDGGEYLQILHYLSQESFTVKGQSPWKFAGIKFKGELYIYPHNLFYLLERGHYKLSDEFKFAIMFGEPLSKTDLVTRLPLNNKEFDFLRQLIELKHDSRLCVNYENYRMQNNISWPLSCLPHKYLVKSAEYIAINAEVPLNMDGTSLNGAEYRHQEFYLPKHAENDHLRSILARQSLDMLAVTEMRNTFARLKDACNENPKLAKAMLNLIIDRDQMKKFQRRLSESETNYSGYRARLVEKSALLFPIEE